MKFRNAPETTDQLSPTGKALRTKFIQIFKPEENICIHKSIASRVKDSIKEIVERRQPGYTKEKIFLPAELLKKLESANDDEEILSWINSILGFFIRQDVRGEGSLKRTDDILKPHVNFFAETSIGGYILSGLIDRNIITATDKNTLIPLLGVLKRTEGGTNTIGKMVYMGILSPQDKEILIPILSDLSETEKGCNAIGDMCHNGYFSADDRTLLIPLLSNLSGSGVAILEMVLRDILMPEDRDILLPLLDKLVNFVGGIHAIVAMVEKNILTVDDQEILGPLMVKMAQINWGDEQIDKIIDIMTKREAFRKAGISPSIDKAATLMRKEILTAEGIEELLTLLPEFTETDAGHLVIRLMVKQFILTNEHKEILMRYIKSLSETETGREAIREMIEKKIFTEEENSRAMMSN